MQRPPLKTLFLLLILCLVAAGCGGNAGTQSSNGPVYTIADETGDWGYPSPYGHYLRGPGYIRMSLIFDTLIWKDKEGYVPALAREWVYDPEENVYIFTLRDDVTWHDGEPFDASDVVFTFNYIKEHPHSWVDGTKIEKVTAEGPYKVKFHLIEPYAPFLSNIAGTMPILPEHIYKDVDKPGEFRGEKAVVGTGPFKLLDYNKEHGTYLYEANENYYGGTPAVKQLKFVKVSKEMAASALKQGEVNAAEIPPETVKSFENTAVKVIQSPYEWNAKLIINHHKDPFSSQKFRQALAYAIDRRAVVDIALRGHGVAAGPGMLPPDSPWYNAGVNQYNFDLQKAKSLLEELGYRKSPSGFYEKDGKVLTVELLTWPRFTREAEIIKGQLENAGIKVDARSLEAKTVDTRVDGWEFELALSGHGGLGGDPETLNKHILGQGFNSARYDKNDRLTELLKKQVHEMDDAKRKQLVDEIQKIYAGEIPALSLYHPAWYWGHDGSVSLYYTPGGVGSGVPIPLNKLCFVK